MLYDRTSGKKYFCDLLLFILFACHTLQFCNPIRTKFLSQGLCHKAIQRHLLMRTIGAARATNLPAVIVDSCKYRIVFYTNRIQMTRDWFFPIHGTGLVSLLDAAMRPTPLVKSGIGASLALNKGGLQTLVFGNDWSPLGCNRGSPSRIQNGPIAS